MHAILITVGTDGDIFPYVGLGTVLRARGHTVTLVASEHYEPLARRHGFAFRALISKTENDALFHHPDFWHPFKTGALSARWGVRFIRRQYELVKSITTPDSVLIASPGVFAAPLVYDKLGTPWASIVLQPWLLPSPQSRPVIPGLPFLSHAPPFVWSLFEHAMNLYGGHLFGRELNRFRTELGLKPWKRVFKDWLSPQLILALFPEWFAPIAPDWPKQVRLTGFPIFDSSQSASLPPDVQSFCESGSPPVAITFGTGMVHSAKLFRAALEACETMKTRAILLTKHRDQLPAHLPPHVLHCTFAPFAKLFLHCSAVIHHGGIGTTAQCFAAGVPQLIHPICFDQIDNGVRVRRLGAGDYLRSTPATAQQIAQALRPLLTSEAQFRARSLITRFQNTNALESAATLIESLTATAPPDRTASSSPAS
ncbi:MAG: glycosyl transferase family 28 [Verrucomicrobia bacterium]|jgi:UDP:flavonoid glycosyltransferase YjiC (YdhE family)|nr:glycosyl transferase family 28 [Verrucomicrobiota bacterium]